MKLRRLAAVGRRPRPAEPASEAPAPSPAAPAPAPAPTPAESAVRVNRSAGVLLRADGVWIPRSGVAAEVPAAPWVLQLVADLAGAEPVSPSALVAEISEREGIPAFDVHIALKRFRDRGFLSSDAGPSAAAAPPATFQARSTDDVGGATGLVVGSPRLLRIVEGRFEALDSVGHVLAALTPVELAAASAITMASSLDEGHAHHRDRLGERALDRESFDALARELVACRILELESECRTKAREQALLDRSFSKAMSAQAALRSHFDDEVARMRATEQETGTPRVAVIPIHSQFVTPLSLGMIVAYATAFEDGRLLDDFAFMPAGFFDAEHMRPLLDDAALFLFSDYVWSHASNLEHSAKVKEVNPRCLVVHGGPDAPKYEADVAAYFEANPFIDVVVHGEGEQTFAGMLAALAPVAHDADRDMSVLSEVPGLSYRAADGSVVRTGDRDRLADINVIPSPYLTGVYEAYSDGGIDTAMIETNRGCPYSCTFCDWGSSTASRIRKFDLDRVFGELEWCARNRVSRIFFCDANFGIFERDVEIAQKVADLRREYGFPEALTTNYAKNTVKHLQKIVQIMADAGVVTEGLLSLQSMDDDTLKTIRRSNIKVEKYDALAAEFREAHLPLLVDLMIGLPGSTTASLREDFQQCIDREVNAKVFQTELLVNSPMNDPVYRAENAIETERTDGKPAVRIPTRGSAGAGRALVVSSSSYTREDYDEMLQLRAVFRLVENFAVLRLTARFLRQEVGMREADLIEALRATTHEDPDRWPHLTMAMRVVPEHMVPPVSWVPFIDEVRAFAQERLGVEASSAFDAVLDAQLAVLPGPNRSFPHLVELPHDVGAWYRDVLRAKDDGHRLDWADQVSPLASYPPVTFVVEDPDDLCEVGLGFGVDVDPYASWELSSPVSRLLASHHTVLS